MDYDVDYFINKFESIPKEQWCTMFFDNNKGQKCAQGHCGMNIFNYFEVWKAGSVEEVRPHLREAYTLVTIFGCNVIANINNGMDTSYQQTTPKQRVLAALYNKKAELAVKEVQNIIGKSISKQHEYAGTY